MGDEEFFILSLKWSGQSFVLNWWCPNNNGYTHFLDKAGRYTRAQVEGNPNYYNDGKNTLAVPCNVVESKAGLVTADWHVQLFREANRGAFDTTRAQGGASE